LYDTTAATAATPITAISVVNLMIRSAAFIGHAVKRKLSGQKA